MARSLVLFVAAAALLAASACDSTEPRVPTSLRLTNEAALSLEVGDTATLGAIVLDQHGEAYTTPPTDVLVTWTSSANTVATVSNGKVTAVGPGIATITASAAGLTAASTQVTVIRPTFTGQLSFAYSGDASGSFDVNSTFQIDPEAGPNVLSWALTVYDAEYGSQDIVAQRQRGDGRFDIIYFWSDGPPVTGAGPREASFGVLLLGYSTLDESQEGFYLITGGTIHFAAPAGRNLSGTFSLQAQHEDTGAELLITSGSFNVPLVSVDILGDASASLQHEGRAGPPPPSRTRRHAPLSDP
jgi:hypothetical protein